MEGRKIDEKEREVWIGESRIYLGKDDIFYITIVGEIDEKIAQEFKKAFIKFNKKFGKKRRSSLTDINKAGKVSSQARKILKELSEDDEIGRGKGGIYGLHPVARVIASFFTSATKNKDQHFFKTKEEALAWLKE